MRGRICIVDHDLGSRGFLRECLEREGLEVTTLENGFEINDRLFDKNFRIFILNVDAPGVRNKNLILEIKKTNQSRILLVVSERGDAFLKDAIDLGVYGFIHKPFNPQEVCTMVNHLIR